MKTLEQVATDLGLYGSMERPVLWLARQLRAKRIPGRKVGRHWMMTAADVEAALATWGNQGERPSEIPRLGLTAASMRRRAS